MKNAAWLSSSRSIDENGYIDSRIYFILRDMVLYDFLRPNFILDHLQSHAVTQNRGKVAVGFEIYIERVIEQLHMSMILGIRT